MLHSTDNHSHDLPAAYEQTDAKPVVCEIWDYSSSGGAGVFWGPEEFSNKRNPAMRAAARIPTPSHFSICRRLNRRPRLRFRFALVVSMRERTPDEVTLTARGGGVNQQCAGGKDLTSGWSKLTVGN